MYFTKSYKMNFYSKKILLVTLLALSVSSLFAQNGRYDVQFKVGQSADCDLGEAYFDIEIKAMDANSTFRVSDQNYRFSFNDDAITNPRIAEEFDISGLIQEGPNAPSFYSSHSLNGSTGTIVSYGFELLQGIGYFIGEDWVPVGRVVFDVVDTTACVNLQWHDSGTFPSTFIGEKFDNELYVTRENSFTHLEECIRDLCRPLPIELSSFSGEEINCEIELIWQTLTETNSSHFMVQKSKDGVTFSDLDRVEAARFSNAPLSYNYIDETPGIYNYYRLKQVDLDGSYEYSYIIKIDSDCYEPGIINGITEIYPNPTNTGRTIRVQVYTSDIQTGADLIIRDISGRLMYCKNIALDAGANTVAFIPDRLTPGLYFVQVRSDEWFSQPQKLVIVE